MSQFRLTLGKEDFKFSSAHFTLFGPEQAELLHGHNYQVELELCGRNLDEDGLLFGFVPVKEEIRALCAFLDSLTLIPTRSRYLQVREETSRVEVVFGDRTYVLPREDVLLLPIVNTSIECFSRLIWHEMAIVMRDLPETQNIESLGVGVSETAGQSCRFHASLSELEEIAPQAGRLEGRRREDRSS